MATPSTSTFVLFGSGPGIGVHVATLFAKKHFQHIILLSRDTDRLEEDAAAVRAVRPGMHVTAIGCDLSKLQSVRDALAAIDQVLQADGTTLEVVCFNAARVRPTDLLTEPPEEYETDFKVIEPKILHSSAVFRKHC
jgi:NAD(P)-dependent dehydrogenase (short-subunit alcohol dehydrogenase family)